LTTLLIPNLPTDVDHYCPTTLDMLTWSTQPKQNHRHRRPHTLGAQVGADPHPTHQRSGAQQPPTN
jgi:hypothetical protein